MPRRKLNFEIFVGKRESLGLMCVTTAVNGNRDFFNRFARWQCSLVITHRKTLDFKHVAASRVAKAYL